MNRRTYLVTAGSTASVLLAGCLSSDETDDTNETDETDDGDDSDPNATHETDDRDDSETNENASDDRLNSEPIDAVEAYLQAGKEASVEATIEAVHEDSPLIPFLEEGETDFEDDEIEDVEIVGHETIAEDVTAADVLDLQYAETLFQDEDKLTDTLNEEDAVLLDVEFDPADSFREDTWVVVTEDEEWKMFWATAEPTDDPDEQFEPEVIDEDETVVTEVDWNPDLDNPGEWAQVTLTDDPGLEADAVLVESTVGGSEFEFSGDSQNAWAGAWANVNLNSAGDQIVVTAITDNEETVVHRVHYDPDEHLESPEIELEILISGPDGEQPFFERTDIATVAEVDEQNGYVVPIQLTDSGHETAIDTFHAVGADEAPEDASITVTVDGDVTVENSFGISPALADAITTNEWDGEFLLIFDEQEQAATVYQGLRLD